MNEIALVVIYWLVMAVGTLGVIATLFWLSFKLFKFILKSLDIWWDTIILLAFYNAVKRGDRSFTFHGKEYRKHDE